MWREMKDRDKWNPYYNGFCMLFWELEIYSENAKEDWEILNERLA